MCLPQQGQARKWASASVLQALREYHSPLQLRKKIQSKCSNLKISDGLRKVSSLASTRVKHVTRWVFSLNFTKIFLPLALAGFLAILHPHTEIQLGVVAGIIFFTFAFFLATHTLRSSHLAPLLEKAAEVPSAVPSPTLTFTLYQQLPLATISIIWGWLTTLPLPSPLDQLSIKFFARVNGCNVAEAEFSDLTKYRTVSEFFTRRLAPGMRPISSSALVSPSDGWLTSSGPVEGNYLEQVKGVRYCLSTFLGGVAPSGPLPSGGLFQAVIYLSPSDYHRFHSPADWTVTHRRHFPGAMLSVNPRVVAAFPGLFHVNERVVWSGRWQHGFFAMAAVGATNVGSIVADFDPELKTNQTASAGYKHEVEYEKPLSFRKGDDFGYFNFGSTMVIIFEAPLATKLQCTAPGMRMGQPLLL